MIEWWMRCLYHNHFSCKGGIRQNYIEIVKGMGRYPHQYGKMAFEWQRFLEQYIIK